MQTKNNRPQVGVGLLLIKNGNLCLFGKRKNAHGDGEYAGVGGHMENLETFADTIKRELKEEIGNEVQITEPQFLCLSNIEPIVTEPDKIENWDWYPIDKPPSPLFESPFNYLQAYKTGQTFFE